MRRTGARIVWGLLALVHLLVLGADVIAPYEPDDQAREFALCPPTVPRIVDDAGRWQWPPFVTGREPADDAAGTIACREVADAIHPLRFGTRDAEGRWRLLAVDAPGRLLLFGADELGRDILSRSLHGARLSLFAGLLATAVSVAAGLGVGLFTGLAGTTGAAVGAFAIDVTLAMPWVYLLLGVRAALPLDLEPRMTFLVTAVLIGLLGWARLARLVRATVMAVREREFVLAARACGVSRGRLLGTHVLPHAWPVALTQAALLLPQFVLAEVTLSFLGLGADAARPSWGTLLAGLQHATALSEAWWQVMPAIALVPVFLLYYLATRSAGVAPASS